MVLAGYINSAVGRLRAGLIGAPMAVFKLARFCAAGQGQKLMSKAYAENGKLPGAYFAQLFNDGSVFRGIPGAVGEHYAVGALLQYFLGLSVRLHNFNLAAPFNQFPLYIQLGSEIPQHDLSAIAGRGRAGALSADRIDGVFDAEIFKLT